jgi:hypothetical protein
MPTETNDLFDKGRVLGRLEGLEILEEDSGKSELMKNVHRSLQTKSPSLQRVIGMLEAYAAGEDKTLKREFIESIIKDLENRNGKW